MATANHLNCSVYVWQDGVWVYMSMCLCVCVWVMAGLSGVAGCCRVYDLPGLLQFLQFNSTTFLQCPLASLLHHCEGAAISCLPSGQNQWVVVVPPRKTSVTRSVIARILPKPNRFGLTSGILPSFRILTHKSHTIVTAWNWNSCLLPFEGLPFDHWQTLHRIFPECP